MAVNDACLICRFFNEENGDMGLTTLDTSEWDEHFMQPAPSSEPLPDSLQAADPDVPPGCPAPGGHFNFPATMANGQLHHPSSQPGPSMRDALPSLHQQTAADLPNGSYGPDMHGGDLMQTAADLSACPRIKVEPHVQQISSTAVRKLHFRVVTEDAHPPQGASDRLGAPTTRVQHIVREGTISQTCYSDFDFLQSFSQPTMTPVCVVQHPVTCVSTAPGPQFSYLSPVPEMPPIPSNMPGVDIQTCRILPIKDLTPEGVHCPLLLPVQIHMSLT
jgi:hypothetical protein